MAEGKRGARVAPEVKGVGGGLAEGLAKWVSQDATNGWSSHVGTVVKPMAKRTVFRATRVTSGAKIWPRGSPW
jgi:hypothetical protein